LGNFCSSSSMVYDMAFLSFSDFAPNAPRAQ